jgi:hypothetical protein
MAGIRNGDRGGGEALDRSGLDPVGFRPPESDAEAAGPGAASFPGAADRECFFFMPQSRPASCSPDASNGQNSKGPLWPTQWGFLGGRGMKTESWRDKNQYFPLQFSINHYIKAPKEEWHDEVRVPWWKQCAWVNDVRLGKQ